MPSEPQRAPDPRGLDLIARIARSDRDALGEFYDLTSSQVFGLVLRIAGDRSASEEITLDVYKQVWKRASDFDAGKGSPVGWLLLIARSRAIDYLRSKAGRAREREDALDTAMFEVRDASPGPEDSLVNRDRRNQVVRALNSLDEPKRVAITLAFFHGLTHTEISDRLELPVGTVKTRIRSGMQQLKVSLQETGGML